MSLPLLGACGSDEERPPEFVPTPVHPTTCSELLEHGQRSGERILIDGEIAKCAAAGLRCPLDDDAGCPAGEAPVALCSADAWLVKCIEGKDGSP